LKRLSCGTTEVLPSRIRSGEPQNHGNFVVKTDACGELETPSTLEACAPRDDLRVLAVRFLVPAGLLSVLLTGKLLAAWKEFHPSFPGGAGILFTTTTRRREEILCDSLRLRVFGVRFFWLRRGCTVFICVHLWFRFHGF